MISNANQGSKTRQPALVWLAVIVLAAAIVSGIFVNFGIRAPVESKNKTVGLLVDYDELMRITVATPGLEFTDMLTMAYDSGATGIIVRERILGEWEASGNVIVNTGAQFKFNLERLLNESDQGMVSELAINPSATYILTKDPLLFNQIYSLLEAKTRYPSHFEIPGYMVISAQLHSIERSSIGLGFPLAELESAARAGFDIVVRLRNWEPITEESLAKTFGWLEAMPNLIAIGFNDQTMPGGGVDPDIQDILADALAVLDKPLVSFEFYEQTGLPGLAIRLDSNLLRAHAIAENELRRYTDFDTAMDRYSLAATERNMRFIYLRFHGLVNPQIALEPALELISNVREGLEDDGLTVGTPSPIPSYDIPRLPMFFLGAGVIAAGGWLIALAAKPIVKRKWQFPYGILIAIGFAVWAALMHFAPTLSRKLLALAGAIVFPSLSVTLIMMYIPKTRTGISKVKRILRAIALLCIASIMTFAGSIVMSGILGDPTFMLKIDSFFGVKVSHMIPLVLVPGVLWLREEDWFGIMNGAVRSSVKFWHLGVGAVLLIGLVIYILRTGNDSPELISELEAKVRQILDDILGVRPRTKEFLIGHPLMMVLLYYGYRLEMFPFVMVGLIGQISIISTYAHLHTPLSISLLRTFNGLWIGIIIGIIAIIIIESLLGKMRKLYVKHSMRSLI